VPVTIINLLFSFAAKLSTVEKFFCKNHVKGRSFLILNNWVECSYSFKETR